MNQSRRFCAKCKVEIPAERAQAVPDTRLCVACSREVRHEFTVTFTTESLGKADSLRKNYGGIESVTKKRKRLDLDE